MHNDDEWALFLLFRPFVFDKDPMLCGRIAGREGWGIYASLARMSLKEEKRERRGEAREEREMR